MDSTPSSSSSSSALSGMHPSQQPAPVKVENGGAASALVSHNCAGCQCRIADRYLLEALGKFWHEDCLKVSYFLFNQVVNCYYY